MSLKDTVNGKIIGVVIDKVAKSEPRTTAAGVILGGIVAANVDYAKVLQKDPQQIGNLIGAVAVAALGYYTNHKKLQTPPSN